MSRHATPEPAPVAVLLVGHGTRDRAGQREFEELTELVRVRLVANRAANLGTTRLAACYLENAAPTIPEALAGLLDGEPTVLVVAPALLFAAGHVRCDIPNAVRATLARRPRPAPCELRWAEHLGLHPAVIALSQQRLREVVPDAQRAQTAVLLVGRGSRDPVATAEMVQFARTAHGQSGCGRIVSAFLTAQRPSVEEALDELAQENWQQVVVQPHLLLQGELLRKLTADVKTRDDHARGCRWRVAPHLGPSPLVADALIDRIRAAWSDVV